MCCCGLAVVWLWQECEGFPPTGLYVAAGVWSVVVVACCSDIPCRQCAISCPCWWCVFRLMYRMIYVSVLYLYYVFVLCCTTHVYFQQNAVMFTLIYSDVSTVVRCNKRSHVASSGVLVLIYSTWHSCFVLPLKLEACH